MRPIPLIGAALLGLTGLSIAAALQGLWLHDDPQSGWQFHAGLAVSAGAYLYAVTLLRRGGEISLGAILGVAIAIRLALLITPPMLSSDLYRYAWDGRVQLAGINPYLFIPADEALRFLRDDVLYANMNRVDYAHTIYPPAAQAFFALVAAISPTVTAWRVAAFGLDLAAIWAVIRLLDASGQSRAQVLIYAWNPLVFWEFANNAHVDVLAIVLLLLAVLMVARRPAWAGIALGLATLTKLLPAAIAPALWPRGRWRLALAMSAVLGELYTIYAHWGGAGWQVLGFLGQYRQEEALDSGAGYWLLALLGQAGALPGWASSLYLAIAAAGLAALGWHVAFRLKPADALAICRAAASLILALMLVLSPHYAWYYAWLAAFAAVAPSRAAIWLSSAALLLTRQTLPDHVLIPSLIFVPTLYLIWADWRAPVAEGTR